MLKFSPHVTGIMSEFQVSEFDNAAQALSLVKSFCLVGNTKGGNMQPKEIKATYPYNSSSTSAWRQYNTFT